MLFLKTTRFITCSDLNQVYQKDEERQVQIPVFKYKQCFIKNDESSGATERSHNAPDSVE